MGSALPLADPAPLDGLLPGSVAEGAENRDLGLYVHVPFCRVRCGYCDFNTYTATELRGARQQDYADEAIAEMALGAGVLERAGLPRRPAATVFFGGGTPTLLPAGDLVRMLDGLRGHFGVAPGAEITTEANPDSVDAAYLRALADAGFTRVSFGMQSAVPHVLATLERTHDPERVPFVVEWAREAGLQVSLDLIYGTPGESLADWELSLDSALANHPDHLSAYALIVEDGTKLARQIRRGEFATPDDDLTADMYELADARLAAAGYSWYEVSNWSRDDAYRSRHNLSYWLGHDWWGVGPGAHSHVGGVRWWNVKHPAAYADRLSAGSSPAAGRETLDAVTRRVEDVLLRSRLADGLPIDAVAPDRRREVAGLIADGLVDGRAALRGRVVLTLRGRLLADAVVRRLTDG
ncbi:radical SAM family heme chaperone HemW [Rathayibacter tanaceti]|uniref:Heme chaperone HemW n=2 Tax=Rathayibacter tanaceti TaxID=1671680 RepID=A0A166HAD6_9MICO|nr:radical SAM family heme chaperone HemW [Rathayibacter tanaceti]KZX20244.1 Oxygen-independent coproporphyrinogen-III oxidase 1 [Rathayibacter tanaceti]QHC55736.1 coproporphyrinogen III oxidase [Rathayibacter tanaceti]TCO39451.1 oxygen-independent coproporphyrinogen-3 oxidase [Rathayibacter tanaceti]